MGLRPVHISLSSLFILTVFYSELYSGGVIRGGIRATCSNWARSRLSEEHNLLHSVIQSTLVLTIRDTTISCLLRFDLVESIMSVNLQQAEEEGKKRGLE